MIEKFDSHDFTKNMWTSFPFKWTCVLKKNILLKFYFHLKDDKNCIGGPCIKNPFYMFIKTLDEIKENFPQNIPKHTQKMVHFLT
jgi:hypothetical protein